MSNQQHGSQLQNFNSELVKSLESISDRRQNVLNEIQKEEDKRREVDTEISKIKIELQKIDDVLENKYAVKNEFEKVIFNTESAFKKILENSKYLMQIVQKDENRVMNNINENKQNHNININSSN